MLSPKLSALARPVIKPTPPPVYKYKAYDLASNAFLGTIPMRNVRWSRHLNAPGQLTGNVPMGSLTELRRSGVAEILRQEARVAVFVDRSGVLVWGGILWQTTPRGGGGIDIACEDFLSYLAHVDTPDSLFTRVDQIRIAELLLELAAANGHDIGVVLSDRVSGVIRGQQYISGEHKPLLETIQQLAGLDNGFDFAIDVTYVDGEPVKQFVPSYPRRGRLATETEVILTLPGNLAPDYTWTRDGTKLATHVTAVGTGEGDSQLQASATNPALIAAGWPRLDLDTSYSDVTDQDALDAHARADADLASTPWVTPTVSTRGGNPGVGSFIEGDYARVRITDENFPPQPDGSPGLDASVRILDYEVAPDDATGDEVITFTLNGEVGAVV